MNLDHVVLLHFRHVIDHQTKGKVRQRIGEETRLNAEGNVEELVRAVLCSSSYAHAMGRTTVPMILFLESSLIQIWFQTPTNFVFPGFSFSTTNSQGLRAVNLKRFFVFTIIQVVDSLSGGVFVPPDRSDQASEKNSSAICANEDGG